MARRKKVILLFSVKHDCFKISFLPSTVIEWNNLDSNVRTSDSLPISKKCIRMGLGHLRFHEIKHSFHNTLNPICNCGTMETTIHYLFHCPKFSNERLAVFNSIDENIVSKNNSNILKVLLFGDHSFNDVKNTSVFN